MTRIAYLIICIIFFACESDPIKSKLHNGIEFEQYTFEIDNFTESYQVDFQNIAKGESNLLFSGYIFDILLDGTTIKDTSRALISIDLSKFSDYDICSSVVRIDPPKVSLYSSLKLSEIFSSNQDDLNIKLVSVENYDEDQAFWTESGIHSIDISNVIDENLNYSVMDSSENELIIDLPNSFISQDSTALICDENNNISLVIEYFPNESSDFQYIDWYSSDFNYGNSLTPKINLDYTKMESVDTTEYQFNIDNYLDSHSKYYYINNILDNNWSTTFFMNVVGLNSGTIDSIMDFSSLVIEDPLINMSNLSTKVDLAVLRIELNDNPLAQDSISQILLALEDVIAYVNEDDPSADDYDGLDSTLTDGNTQYDILYNSIGSIIASEKFNDFGSDNCENQFEKGNGECCENDEECVYNNEGSENNSLLNWLDNDGDGLWSNGDTGEEWIDFGSDGCTDEYETGDLDNPCSDSPDNSLLGTDPNGDNYNIDPNEDNYNSETDLGFENNGELDWTDDNNNEIWEEGEGEQWLDYGLDGIPDTYDIYENDKEFQQDFEPFFDYGLDNIEDQSEPGFCNSLISCTENNFQYDVGELNDINDLGIDGCTDEYEIGTKEDPNCQLPEDGPNPDYVPETDPHGDNYNIDPNSDNYNSVTDSGFENNDELDWTDGNNNGIWDEEEGEQWFDYGLDQTENEYEQYLPENQIIVSLSNNEYQIDINDFSEYSELGIPNTADNKVALWISSITSNAIEDVYDLTLSIYSERQLDGIKLKLDHPDDFSNLKVSWAENYERNYSGQYSYVEDGEYQDKIFKDLSLYPLRGLDFYSETLPDSLVLMNYGYDVFCHLNSDKFNSFVNEHSGGSISLQYSKIIIPIEMLSHDSDIKVDIDIPSQYLSSSNYITESPYGYVEYGDDRMEIDIGSLIQYYMINDDIPFEGFILRNNSKSYNFNSLYLNKHNSYIQLVIQK